MGYGRGISLLLQQERIRERSAGPLPVEMWVSVEFERPVWKIADSALVGTSSQGGYCFVLRRVTSDLSSTSGRNAVPRPGPSGG